MEVRPRDVLDSCPWHLRCYISPRERHPTSLHPTPRFSHEARAAHLEVIPMLPPYIIEEIRRRENEQRRQHEAPQIELPLPLVPPPAQSPRRDDDDRGVIIIDL